MKSQKKLFSILVKASILTILFIRVLILLDFQIETLTIFGTIASIILVASYFMIFLKNSKTKVDNWLKLVLVSCWGISFLFFFLSQQDFSNIFWFASFIPLLILAFFTFGENEGSERNYPIIPYIKMAFLLQIFIFFVCHIFDAPIFMRSGISSLTIHVFMAVAVISFEFDSNDGQKKIEY